MLIEDWDKGMSTEDKIKHLLKQFNVSKPVNITEYNKEYILEMLNRNDVSSVFVTDSGDINIEHYGD